MGLNVGTFLKRLDGVISGNGFKKVIPISLWDFHLDNSVAALGAPGGNEPGLVKENDHLTIQWPATKVLGINVQFILPDDYDEAQDHLILKLKAMMDGTTNTTTAFEAAAYTMNGTADLTAETEDMAPDNTADLSATAAWVDIDLSDNVLLAGDVISVDINPEAHDTDVVEIWAAKIEYKSDLVFYDPDDR